MLAGRYPSDEFAELRPRIVWDRVAGSVTGRPNARPLAVANAGTIPDRGLYGVFLADGRAAVGELDEEMVYEARVGQTFLLGASELAHRAHHPRPRARLPRAGPAGQDAVLARRGRRPAGRARPRARRVRARDPARCPRRAPLARLRDRPPPRRARGAQPAALPRRAAGGHRRAADRPHHRRRALPRRARRLAPVHPLAVRRPGARAVGAGARRAAARASTASRRRPCGRTTASSCTCPTPTSRRPATLVALDPDGDRGPGRARARRLRAVRRPLPRERRPRAADPAPPARPAHAAVAAAAQGAVAAGGRGGLRLVPDRARDVPRVPAGRASTCPALVEVLRGMRAPRGRRWSRSRRRTARRSPSSLLFDYVAQYMYEGDAPLAERAPRRCRSTASVLRELLGQEELRDLLDPEALAEVERADRAAPPRQRGRRRCTTAAPARRPGAERGRRPARRRPSSSQRGAPCRVRIAGEERLIAAEDAGRYRDAIGACRRRACRTRSSSRCRTRCAASCAATRAPTGRSPPSDVAARWGVPRPARPRRAAELERDGTVVRCGCGPAAGRRLVRRGGAAPHPARHAGRLRARGGGRARRGAGALPAALAAASTRAAAAASSGCATHRQLQGAAAARRDPGAGGAAAARAGLPPGPARRAVRRRRGRVVGRRRRPGRARPSAPTRRCSARRPAPPSRPRGELADALRAQLGRGGALLRGPRRAVEAPRGRGAGGAVGPGLGRRGHERRVRPAARAAHAAGRAPGRARPDGA